jgi:Helix-turn-helix domain
VGIGGALAGARTEAGLTVTEVSERTRIRATIILGIEHDDYTACGGDYYARGHIRAIARVVGTDPVPLIEEYDAVHMPPPEPVGPADDTDTHSWRLPAWQRFVGPNSQAGNGPSGLPAGQHDTDPGTGVPGGITAAEAFRPWMPLEPKRRLPKATVALGLMLLAAIAVLTYLLVSGGSSTPQAQTSHQGSSRHLTSSRHVTHRPAGSSAASQPASVPLAPLSAAAVGPDGTSQGDDPQQASLAIDGSDSTAWQTDWYATANFGGLYSGTGLLLDMGKPVTVTSARILLGAAAGGSLELRAGNSPSLADLPVVASAQLPGGALTLSIDSPVKARFLLIWFTRLPPDNSGTYQDSIANVSLSGTT